MFNAKAPIYMTNVTIKTNVNKEKLNSQTFIFASVLPCCLGVA